MKAPKKHLWAIVDDDADQSVTFEVLVQLLDWLTVDPYLFRERRTRSCHLADCGIEEKPVEV